VEETVRRKNSVREKRIIGYGQKGDCVGTGGGPGQLFWRRGSVGWRTLKILGGGIALKINHSRSMEREKEGHTDNIPRKTGQGTALLRGRSNNKKIKGKSSRVGIETEDWGEEKESVFREGEGGISGSQKRRMGELMGDERGYLGTI